MLTRGQAARIAFYLIPTVENRALAKKSLEDSLFDIAHTDTKDVDSFPTAKVFIEKNPAKYKTYPDTPTSISKIININTITITISHYSSA